MQSYVEVLDAANVPTRHMLGLPDDKFVYANFNGLCAATALAQFIAAQRTVLHRRTERIAVPKQSSQRCCGLGLPQRWRRVEWSGAVAAGLGWAGLGWAGLG